MSEFKKYCCIRLLDAEKDGFLAEVSSGFYLPNKNPDEHCLDGNPMLSFCPFCGAEIITTKNGICWDWYVVPKKEKQ